MAETIQGVQLADPVEILEDAPGASPQTMPDAPPPEGTEDVPQESSKDPKRRDILLPVLTVLLILIGIGEAVFWGYFGFSAYARSLARERYEEQQRVLEEERASRGLGGSSYSPNLKVENGTVVWEREQWRYSGSGQAANTAAGPQREDGVRLSGLPVIKIPYTLAERDNSEA